MSASWSLAGKSLSYDIVVPVGSKGTVYLDSASVTESGRGLQTGKNGILGVGFKDGQTVIGIGSGSYKFLANLT